MEPRQRSASASSARSAASRASTGSAMGPDGGEAGWRAAQEEDILRREMLDSTAFCNSFWGFSDAGYPVVQNRMKGGARVLDELRAMYKERAEIEAEYAKRLQKLARQPLGRDETGLMRTAIETVRGEIDMMARSHSELSQVFKRDLEGQAAEFNARIQNQRKSSSAQIEKLYKQKMMQESYVSKSREKYEQDCFKINGYTAQSSLVQGRDLEKVTSKLDKAQSSVSANERDYQNFIRALKDTTLRWNTEWKSYLDECQDLEEERLDFLKSNLWTYANSISSVCVADDQSCERVRVALESCEAARDIVDFIHHAGTGNTIPDPPEYIDYSRGKPPPPRPTYRTANFHRTSTRPTVYPQPAEVQESTSFNEIPRRRSGAPSVGGQTNPPDGQELEMPAGDASLPGNESSLRDMSVVPPSESTRSGPQPSAMQGAPTSSSIGTDAGTTIFTGTPTKDVRTDKTMSAKNFLAQAPGRGSGSVGAPLEPIVTNAAAAPRSANVPPSATTSTVTSSADQDDPISKALAELRMKPTRSTASSQTRGPPPPSKSDVGSSGPARYGGPPPPSTEPHYAAGSDHRPHSPSAAFMREPQRATSPVPVEDVVTQYGQSFPGERRALSRQNSTASRNSRVSVQPSQQLDRARSPGPQQGGAQGFAGVGARGRSPSPQPFQGNPNQASQQSGRPTSIKSGQPAISPIRATTPLGISLDASGSVTHDQMAEDYIRRSGSTQPTLARPVSMAAPSNRQSMQPQHSYQGSQAPASPYQQHARTTSYNTGMQGPSASYQGEPRSPAANVSQSGYTASPQGAPGGYGYAQPSQQRQPSGAASAAPSASPQFRQQQSYDTAGSLSRQTGALNGYSQSPYNQRPASAIGHQANQYAQPPPAASAYAGAPQHRVAPSQSSIAPPPPADTPASAYMHQYQQQHGQSYAAQNAAASPAPAPSSYHQQSYSQAPPPSQSQQSYAAPAPNAAQSRSNGYGSSSGQPYQAAPPSQYAYAQQAQQAPLPQQQQQQQPAQQRAPPQQAAPAPAPPTGQFSDAGKPILFYVKALYDYHAQLDEEFSFTAGDVIAVWETSPDGWWQGELLDDARRRAGANTFPSNFVSLLN